MDLAFRLSQKSARIRGINQASITKPPIRTHSAALIQRPWQVISDKRISLCHNLSSPLSLFGLLSSRALVRCGKRAESCLKSGHFCLERIRSNNARILFSLSSVHGNLYSRRASFLYFPFRLSCRAFTRNFAYSYFVLALPNPLAKRSHPQFREPHPALRSFVSQTANDGDLLCLFRKMTELWVWNANLKLTRSTERRFPWKKDCKS